MSRLPAKKELGQHFLVDENILGVIGRLAELDADRRRARGRPRPRRPHALPGRRASRTSTRSSSTLARAAAARASRGRRSTGGTRSRSTCARSTRPRPSSLRTCPTTSPPRLSSRASTACPGIDSWCVMVQREVADRFFAAPGTKAYGAVSVLDPARDRADRLPSASRARCSARGRTSSRRSSRSVAPLQGSRRRRSASSRGRSPTGARRSPTRSRSPASSRGKTPLPRSRRSGSSRRLVPRS